ncbi:MAG TPA: FAD binding domain-containing protein, partial [Burkholderiaceae bacterium]|nr:FAD binding domain-containing protein [Burkholderiaceae bacterium]
MNDFDYHRPETLAQAVELLRTCSDPRLLAGGQSLLGALKLGLASASDLIDLSRIAELKGIGGDSRMLRIGATSSHAQVAASPEVRQRIPALAELADHIGDPSVRTMGTIGGSLANNDPAACYPAAVLALAASVHTDRRTIAADAFFTGLYSTALEPGEIVTAVEFPVPRRAAYVKFTQPASRFALVGVFVSDGAAGIRVAVTGAGPCVFRVPALEQALSR